MTLTYHLFVKQMEQYHMTGRNSIMEILLPALQQILTHLLSLISDRKMLVTTNARQLMAVEAVILS